MEPLLLERSAVLGPQKMHVLNSLAGGVAHDINNVLTAILGYGALAQKRAAEGSCVRRCIDNIMQAGVRAQAIVDGMLEFSRSNVMELVPVNVQSVVEETVELLVAALPSGVRLYRQFYAGDAAVLANPTQLHRLVMNLCMNAVQAMVNGGVLEVLLEQVEVADSRTLSHGELTAGRYVRLAVCDTGVGINPRVLDRIFDPLFTTRSSAKGTGLGLAIVHAIVAAIDGSIDVASAEGQGTTFTIWMPVADVRDSVRTGAAR